LQDLTLATGGGQDPFKKPSGDNRIERAVANSEGGGVGGDASSLKE